MTNLATAVCNRFMGAPQGPLAIALRFRDAFQGPCAKARPVSPVQPVKAISPMRVSLAAHAFAPQGLSAAAGASSLRARPRGPVRDCPRPMCEGEACDWPSSCAPRRGLAADQRASMSPCARRRGPRRARQQVATRRVCRRGLPAIPGTRERERRRGGRRGLRLMPMRSRADGGRRGWRARPRPSPSPSPTLRLGKTCRGRHGLRLTPSKAERAAIIRNAGEAAMALASASEGRERRQPRLSARRASATR